MNTRGLLHLSLAPTSTHGVCCTVMQEGRPRHECYTPQVLQQIQADNWNFAAPGGESQRQLEERVVSEWGG